MDDHRVTTEDRGNNFFVTEDSIGRPRCEVVKELLMEMNPDVKGQSVDSNSLQAITNNPDFLSQFSLVYTTYEYLYCS